MAISSLDPMHTKIWEAYEKTKSIAETSRQLKLTYSEVRRVLQQDPIRFADIELAQHEEQAQRWAEMEQRLNRSLGGVIDLQDQLITHVLACLDQGIDTDLIRPKGAGNMTAMEAVQWLIQNRVLDGVSKGGFQAAKVAEHMRTLKMNGLAGKTDPSKGANIDPSNMSTAEIKELIRQYEEAGLALPESLALWAHQLPAGSGTTG